MHITPSPSHRPLGRATYKSPPPTPGKPPPPTRWRNTFIIYVRFSTLLEVIKLKVIDEGGSRIACGNPRCKHSSCRGTNLFGKVRLAVKSLKMFGLGNYISKSFYLVNVRGFFKFDFLECLKVYQHLYNIYIINSQKD